MKKQGRKEIAKLGKEMATLGSHIVDAIKSSAIRDELKGVGKDAIENLRATGQRLTEALQKAREGEATQEIKDRARKLFEIGKSEGEKNTRNLRKNLAKGLHSIGQELQDLAQKLNKK